MTSSRSFQAVRSMVILLTLRNNLDKYVALLSAFNGDTNEK